MAGQIILGQVTLVTVTAISIIVLVAMVDFLLTKFGDKKFRANLVPGMRVKFLRSKEWTTGHVVEINEEKVTVEVYRMGTTSVREIVKLRDVYPNK